jgi:TRAP-type C4-dicarboxylate transport system permease small subunit
MFRTFLQEALIFLLPWLVFYGYLLAVGRNPHQRANWEAHVFRLTMAGVGLVVLSLVAIGLFGERHRSGYVPPRLENGRIVPGTFQ